MREREKARVRRKSYYLKKKVERVEKTYGAFQILIGESQPTIERERESESTSDTKVNEKM